MASLRMFFPHQPEPINAVRYLRPDSAPRSGTALKARLAAAAVRINCRRVGCIRWEVTKVYIDDVCKCELVLFHGNHRHVSSAVATINATVGQHRGGPAFTTQN